MAISFSGLASGLDTSSWVESLTALKRAKVTTLQEKKEVAALSLNTLNSIKSFFSSFRSLLEKVTDTRFNIATMDVFAKNIATSSNTKILSALATTEAEEGTYEIDVKKLASNTQATSKYTYETQIVTTTKATNDTLLKHIGVTTGEINVNVDGSNRTVVIGENDTIGTFAQKLKNAGVDAGFNEKTGVFSMNINASDITDTDSTGIVDALHLSDVNKGFVSDEIYTNEETTDVVIADETTKLSLLGVKAGTIILSHDNQEYDITLEEGDTVGDLITALGGIDVSASIVDGVFTMEDVVIVNDGVTKFVEAFGLSGGAVSGNIHTGENLTYVTSTTTTTNATLDTKLNALDTGVTVENGDTVIVKNNSGQLTTINLSATSTVGDLLSGMNSAGLTASIDGGVVSLSGGEIVGGTYNAEVALGLAENITDTTVYHMTGSNTLFANSTSSTTVNGSTTFEDMEFEGDSTVTIVNSNNQTVGTITMSTTETMNDFINKLSGYGITATLNNGQLSFSTTGNLINGGTIADKFGIRFETSVQTVSSSQTSTGNVMYTTTQTATLDTTAAQLGINGQSWTIYNSSGDVAATGTASGSLQELFNTWSQSGVNASINNGVISITSTNGSYVAGDVCNTLGITNANNGYTQTTGGTTTSGSAVTYTTTVTETVPVNTTVTTGISQTSTAVVTYTQTFTGGATEYTTTTSGVTNTGSVVTYTSNQISSTSGETITTTIGNTVSSSVPITYTTTTVQMSDASYEVTTGVGMTSSGAITYTSQLVTTTLQYTTTTSNITSTEAITYQATTTIGTTVTGKVVFAERIELDGNTLLRDVWDVGSDDIIIETLRGDYILYNDATVSDLLEQLNFDDAAESATLEDGVIYFDSYAALGVHTFRNATTGAVLAVSQYSEDGYITAPSGDTYGGKIEFSNVTEEPTIGTIGRAVTSTATVTYTTTTVVPTYTTTSDYATQHSGIDDIFGTANVSKSSTFSIGFSGRDGYVTGTFYLEDVADYHAKDWSNVTLDNLMSYIEYRYGSQSGHGGFDQGVSMGAYYSDGLTELTFTTLDGMEHYLLEDTLRTNIVTQSGTTTQSVIKTLDTTARLSAIDSSFARQYITVVQNNTEKVVTLTDSNTVAQMISAFGSVGITATVSNGRLTLAGSDSAYIKTMSSKMATAFKLSASPASYSTIAPSVDYFVNKEMTEDSTIEELYNRWEGEKDGTGVPMLTVHSNGVDTVCYIDEFETVGDFLNTLNSYDGITASLQNGAITIEGDENAWITPEYYIEILGLCFDSSAYYTEQAVTATATTATTGATLGMTGNGTIVLQNTSTGSFATVTYTSTNILVALEGPVENTGSASGSGISMELVNGKYTISATGDWVISDISDNLVDVLNLDKKSMLNTTSANVQVTTPVTATIDNNTTWANIGVTVAQSVTVRAENGTTYTQTIDTTTKISDTLSWLKNTCGFDTATINADGTITIEGGDNAYFVGGLNSTLTGALNLNSTYNTAANCYSTRTVEASEPVTTTITCTLAASDVLFEKIPALVTAVADARTISVISNSTEAFFTIQADTTMQDIVNWFNTDLEGFMAGYSHGSLTVTGSVNSYIKGYGTAYSRFLKMPSDVSSLYTTSVETTEGTTITTPVTKTISNNTTFGQLNGGSALSETSTIFVDGTQYTTTVTQNTKVGDYLAWLKGKGFSTATINSNGTVTIASGEGVYYTDHNDKLDSLLGLSEKQGLGSAYTTVITSSVVETSSTVTATMTELSTFAQLGMTINQSVTVVAEGSTIRVNVTSDMTVGQFMDKLRDPNGDGVNNGFDMSITDGKLTMSGKEDVYVFGYFPSTLGNTLKLELKGSPSDYYTTSTGTVNQEQPVEKTVTMTGTTTFANLELNSTYNVTVMDGGTEKVVTVDGGNINSFMAAMTSAGITTTLADGKLTFKGDSDSYIKSMDSALVNKFGVDTNSFYSTTYINGFSNSNSNQLNVQTMLTATTSTTMDDLELTGSYIKVVDNNGDVASITLDSSMSIQGLCDALAPYGTATFADGRLSFVGNGSNKIAQEGAATAFKIGSASYNTGVAYSNSSSNVLNYVPTIDADTSTKLGNLKDAQGNSLAGYDITVNGETLAFNANNTIQDVINALAEKGVTATLGADNVFTFTSTEGLQIGGTLGVFIKGTASPTTTGDRTVIYSGAKITETNSSTTTVKPTESTLLSDLGVTTGEYILYTNGVPNKLSVSEGDTLGSFMEQLGSFSVTATLTTVGDVVKLNVETTGNTYLRTSTAVGASNIVDKLFTDGKFTEYDYATNLEYEVDSTLQVAVTEDTLISEFDTPSGNMTLTSAGTLGLLIDGEYHAITITPDETFGSLAEKLGELGIEAGIDDNKFYMNAVNKDVSVDVSTTSNILSNLGLSFSDDIDGITASSVVCEETVTTIETRTASVANYADYNTQMKALNISSGTLTVYKNGTKQAIQVYEDETFGQLRSRIATAFGDVDLAFEDGYLKIYSTSEDASVVVGSSVDTSNIVSICGLRTNGDEVISSRELYKVNGSSLVTTSGLFKYGDVTEGTFTVGNATFTIDNTTTLNSIISQINASQEANATAYWDTVDGKFVIKSRVTGESLINVEAGTSNFTDVIGLTATEYDAGGNVVKRKLNTEAQELGGNAEFTINGTDYTSTSNTITSDISKIKGVTINLKEISNGEIVTLTIEKDKESVATAMEDIITGYNELITNVDKELASTGNLHDQTSLKIIRNSIRNLMTNSTGNPIFRNLDAVGISLDKASGANLKTEGIDLLSFNREKFIEAYETDSTALKEMLTGDMGVLTRVESVVEQALASASGYFASAENSYRNQITRIDRQIERANVAVANYKSRLESKFAAMEKIIAGMRDQYSTFLGT